ncbi:MAG: Gfo/Idh/MocA family oxidoreductase [Saprospiraceae bacterium]|nr:Gfo/Idh/MocA family oxidoreductase [Saprospiraceae bacterium]
MPDLEPNQMIKWGILGPGRIAEKFANDLSLVENAEITAVASRSLDRAISFGGRHFNARPFSSYEAIVKEGGVDIMYIATPHTFHLEQTLLCLENGISVLCEKPTSINQKELQRMVDASRQNNVFFMEALWTRFIPSMRKVLEIIQSGIMGEVDQVEAEFCFTAPVDPLGRLYNMSLGGGSILDIGIYPAFLAYQLLGKPKSIRASGQIHDTGADQTCTMNFEYNQKKSAALHCSVLFESNMPARITMTNGYILMQPRWHEAPGLIMLRAGYKPEHISCPPLGKGFTHEIMECHRCLAESKIESDLWSHQNSLDLMGILDEVRKQAGVVYPGRD